MCNQFCDNCKIFSFGHHLKEVEMNLITYACPFLRVSQKSRKNLSVYMVLGDAVSTLLTFVWILKHVSRSTTWSLFILKALFILAPVPCPIPEWPIVVAICFIAETTVSRPVSLRLSVCMSV